MNPKPFTTSNVLIVLHVMQQVWTSTFTVTREVEQQKTAKKWLNPQEVLQSWSNHTLVAWHLVRWPATSVQKAREQRSGTGVHSCIWTTMMSGPPFASIIIAPSWWHFRVGCCRWWWQLSRPVCGNLKRTLKRRKVQFNARSSIRDGGCQAKAWLSPNE